METWGKLLKANENPFEGLEKPANHFGDISEHNGELYTGIEWFEDGRGKDIQIAIYDAETLKFKRAFPWNPESGQVEVSALAVDVPNGLVSAFMCSAISEGAETLPVPITEEAL